MEKDDRVLAEQKRLSKVFKHIEKDKRELCAGLIQNASFCVVTLTDLQRQINEEGAVTDYNNGGGQSGKRISPAVQIYTKLVANYNAIMKQLISLLPAEEKAVARLETDPMREFLNG